MLMQPPFFCDYGSNIELGERVFFNFIASSSMSVPCASGFHTLGSGVQSSRRCIRLNAAQRRHKEYGKEVEIGADVWVGGGALILPGVKIGSRAVIGAGSVVTRNIPEGMFAAGNPCRVIREIAD